MKHACSFTVMLLMLAALGRLSYRDETPAVAQTSGQQKPLLALRALARLQKATKKQRKKRGSRKRNADANALQIVDVAEERPAERVSAVGAGAPATDDFPAVTVTADGAVWAAYLEWNRANSDRVLLRRKGADGKWSDSVELKDGCFEHYSPALAARGNKVLAVWSGHNEDGFDVYAAEVSQDGGVSAVKRLTDAPQSDFNVRCASDAAGNVTVVWQSFRDQQSDVYARKLTGDTWGSEVRVSPGKADDWEPVVAVDSHGTAWIAWDGYEHGNYDVFLRSFDGQKLSEVIAVTTEPSAQFHTSVAVDPKDRVWVAWDDGGINWGKDFSRSSAVEGSQGLHFSRKIEMRVVQEGIVQQPQADLQRIMTGRMARYNELPNLQFDGEGALWLVFRHWTRPKPHEIYHFYATRLSPKGWTKPIRLGHSSGRNSQHPGLALGKDGAIRAVYSSDGRAPDVKPKDAVHALSYVTYLATLPKGDAATTVELKTVDLPRPQPPGARRPRYTYQVGDKRYTLMFGDCHRHTDVRGHSGVDGSALDTYRYALDAAQLDFLGLGDHNQVTGGDWPDGLRDYQWWYEQKFVDLFTHAPTFVGMYSYEHSLGRPSGHRNILHLKRGAPMRVADRNGRGRDNPDNQPPNLWKWMEENVLTQPGQQVVIVPHTFAAGPLADWNWPNARFDCLLEIYQGCRGSYEAWHLPDKEKRGPTQTNEPGHFARDALEKGNVYGFVSFSDHRSTHNSWAGVWVEEPTRAGLFEAMLAKRTFAGSDEIILRVSAQDPSTGKQYAVGENLTVNAARPPVFNIDVLAPDVILRIDVVKDGKYVYTTKPQARTFTGTFADMHAEPGENYYYVRVFQRDPERPDGDPEIAWASPFFVTYR